ncbi:MULTISPECIES: ABC transporter permease [Acidobacterium]|uniref:Efflux ABC transporter, macrolide exporter (MacB) family, permease protein n=1 Tax=Acidobacterium capsulatum (strain ATCC 51196 / DSM 11244 / BCRC 80197 / JCM 7670 / NBRC 15755 / NCIMB 13165 / 161) TaxID=240015 RepID=C1F9G8_ACIC5|nr:MULTISPECIES: ABC transporter permease [Acidobacterium]ACO32024.1 efflux ABC transporter, macrolide exporter (MacB) family, permease protein [Acidobacterium capsulatum ATCC 51196]HCT62179.1 ABC transporter permease [Acidobacterium sp.]
MRWWQRVRMAMVTLFRRRQATEQLSDELAFHLEQQMAENRAAGMSAEDARTAALRAFGNPTLLREDARATWRWNSLEKIWRDVRYGVRTLSRTPGFTVMAVLVMALGIGATTSLFTIVQSVLLSPLPFKDPGKLVMVYEHFAHSFNGGDGLNVVAPGDYLAWQKQTHGFQSMAAWRWWGANLTNAQGQLPEAVQAAGGSWNLFSTLGVPLALGRGFTKAEDHPGGHPVVILTWSLYQRRFGGNPAVLGQQVHLNSVPYTIIGVLPRWFSYPDPSVELWLPYGQTFTPVQYAQNANHQSLVVARLKPGVSAAAATAQVSAVQYRIHLAHASEPVSEGARFRPMLSDMVQDIRTPLLVLMGAVFCMLLIACLNVSNLLVARSAARRKEVAVRSALGGNRLALIREQMTESLLICIAGGGLGVGLSMLVTHWLASHWHDLPRASTVHVNGAVLAFSLGLVFVTAIVAGLLPAISSTGKGVLQALQEGSRSLGGSVSKARMRQILLTAEIALTVVLLIGAGLLFQSFLRMRGTRLGCAMHHVLTMRYSLPRKQYDTPAKVVAFHEALLQRVRHMPGVVAPGLVSTAPGAGWQGDEVFTVSGKPVPANPLMDDALVRTADPGYFQAMQIPLIRGHFFTDDQRLANSKYVIVSRAFAAQYFHGEDPVGQQIRIARTSPTPEDYEIVGVVGDTLYRASKPTKATLYFPMYSGSMNAINTTLMVRTVGDPLNMALPIQKMFATLDPSLPLSEVLTLHQVVGQSTNTASFSATLLLAFAVLSLLLAAVGLYGVLSYLVTQRTTEIGIRIALGAQRVQVLWLVVVDGLRPVLYGLAIGIAGGVGVGFLIRSMLYDTQPLDGAVVAAMAACLAVTAALACAVPAMRATHIEPTEALRVQ